MKLALLSVLLGVSLLVSAGKVARPKNVMGFMHARGGGTLQPSDKDFNESSASKGPPRQTIDLNEQASQFNLNVPLLKPLRSAPPPPTADDRVAVNPGAAQVAEQVAAVTKTAARLGAASNAQYENVAQKLVKEIDKFKKPSVRLDLDGEHDTPYTSRLSAAPNLLRPKENANRIRALTSPKQAAQQPKDEAARAAHATYTNSPIDAKKPLLAVDAVKLLVHNGVGYQDMHRMSSQRFFFELSKYTERVANVCKLDSVYTILTLFNRELERATQNHLVELKQKYAHNQPVVHESSMI